MNIKEIQYQIDHAHEIANTEIQDSPTAECVLTLCEVVEQLLFDLARRNADKPRAERR